MDAYIDAYLVNFVCIVFEQGDEMLTLLACLWKEGVPGPKASQYHHPITSLQKKRETDSLFIKHPFCFYEDKNN